MRSTMKTRTFYEEAAAGDGGAPAGDGGSAGATPVASSGGDWIATLPEGLRGEPSILKYKEGGVPALAEAYVNASRMLGKPADTLLELPTDRSLANLKPLFGKLGAPADAAGYKLAAVEGAHESLGIDKPLAKGFLEDAAAAGLLPDQAQALYAGFVNRLQASIKGQDEGDALKDQEHEAELRKEWGPAWDQKVAEVNHAIDFLGLKDVFNEAGLGMHPTVARALLKVEALLKETPSQDVPNVPRSHSGVLPPEEARAKGKALLAEAMSSGDQFRRQQLNTEAQRYFKMAAGDAVY